LTACSQPAEENITGGYTEDRALEAEDRDVFDKATAELVGVGYEPTLVATQVVAGVNYRFTATATPITPDAKPYTVYVYVYQPPGGEPELGEIVDVE
jgi:hypothetical protein